MASPPHSSSSSATATDVEAQEKTPRVGHFDLVFKPAGITPEILNHPYWGDGTEDSPYVVEFLPKDPHNPLTFPSWKKWCLTFLQASAALAVTFVSSAYSGGSADIVRDFHVSMTVTVLGVSLFVAGFAVGPLFWAPLSEFFGRQILFFLTYGALTAFNAGAAAAPNITSLIILRFFAGAFGSSPMTNAGGVIADMFEARERGLAMTVFAAAPFLGPSLGPIAGGFLGDAAGWRWVEGLMAAFTGLLWILVSLLVPETYAPVLLRKRADALAKITGKVYITKMDSIGGTRSMASSFAIALSRPWILLFREPIVMLTSIYMAIVYGTMYMMFPAFPIVYQNARGWSAGVGGLAFIGLTVGMLFAIAYAMYDNKRYAAAMVAHGGSAPAEARLPPAMIGSFILPVGLFWFAWTNGPEIHWIVSIIGTAVFGAGLVLVFLSLNNYLVDSYVIYAASVMAANSVLRSLFGAAFPLFTSYMYKDLGIHWASSVPAFLSVACIPFPFLFYKYGDKIRMRCKYSAEAAEVLRRMREETTRPAAAGGGGGGAVMQPVPSNVDEALEIERQKTLERRRSGASMPISRAGTRTSHIGVPEEGEVYEEIMAEKEKDARSG